MFNLKNQVAVITGASSGLGMQMARCFAKQRADLVILARRVELLEELKKELGIRKIGKTYTTDSVDYDDYDRSFEPRKHEEFEYKGRKYIPIVGDHNG